jgi:hypothetical protein
MIKEFTLNTSYLLCVRLHVSVLMWPSSGLLTNQVNKWWLHVGIPTMFTDTEGFCWYEFNVRQSTEMPPLDFSFRINNLLSHTSSSHLPAWSLLDHKRKRHVQPLKWKRYLFAKPSTRYLPVIYNRRNHGGIQHTESDVISCSFLRKRIKCETMQGWILAVIKPPPVEVPYCYLQFWWLLLHIYLYIININRQKATYEH